MHRLRRLRRFLPDAGNCSAVIVHPETGLCRAVQARFPFYEPMKTYEQLRPGIFLCQDADHALKLTTDALLLAHFTQPPRHSRIADLGCGAGAVSLLLCAADPTYTVTGIEQSAAACALALDGCRKSGLEARFSICQGDLRQIRVLSPPGKFDWVVCNPPYFPAGSSPDPIRTESGCTLDEVCTAAAWLLKNGGSLSLIYRPERLVDLIVCLRQHHLEPKQIQFIRHLAGSPVSLMLLSARLGGRPGLTFRPDLILYRDDGTPTEIYRAACGL